jgi:hypothetical protein
MSGLFLLVPIHFIKSIVSNVLNILYVVVNVK